MERPLLSFLQRKGGRAFLWLSAWLHAPPALSTHAAPLRRACFARCPSFGWMLYTTRDCRYQELIVLLNPDCSHPLRSRVRSRGEGQSGLVVYGHPRAPSPAASSNGARGGWHGPLHQTAKARPALLFSVKKTPAAASPHLQKLTSKSPKISRMKRDTPAYDGPSCNLGREQFLGDYI